MFDVIAHWKY